MRCLNKLRRRPSPTAERAKTEAAQRELDRVRGQWPAVLRYAAALTEHQRRNHFAESINTIFRGGPA
jgi:hypothetical protein